METIPLYNTEGKEIDKIKLNASVFDGQVNRDAIYQTVVAFRANQRKGLASTKTRGEVSGGGKKPWRQKGTGRARVGSSRNPLWRHGGVVFGPHKRDFSYGLPKKIKTLALKSSLNAKIKNNSLIVFDSLKLEKPKTKEALKIIWNLSNINAPKRKKQSTTLLLLEKLDDNVKLALRNIGFLDLGLAKDTHAYEILSHQKIFISQAGLSEITDRIKK
jgi:large subunit ribosomal protein L4